MLSRVAESYYWMQRYRERAENTARLLAVNFNLSADAPYEIGNQWDPMLQTIEGEDFFRDKYMHSTQKNVLQFMTFDLSYPSSIFSCLVKARENARSIRETIPTEMWQEINTLYLFMQRSVKSPNSIQSYPAFFQRIVRQCQLLTGIADTSLSHNAAWYFGRIGNLIERADMTTRILDAKYYMLLPSKDHIGTPFDNVQWTALLKSASAFEMYRKRWHQIIPANIVNFLVLNPEFPRSFLSCLLRIKQSLTFILENHEGRSGTHPALDTTNQLIEDLSSHSGTEIIAEGFHEYLDNLQLRLGTIHNALQERYFAGTSQEVVA